MIRSTIGSLLLVLLAILSVSPSLAAPQGSHRASHSPYKDYGSGHSNKRQGLVVPSVVDSCMLSAEDLTLPGVQELVVNGISYSRACLEQFFSTEELAFLRTPAAALCVVVPTEADLSTLAFTVLGGQVLDRACLSQRFPGFFPSCLPNNGACMTDRSVALPDVPAVLEA